MNPTIRHHAINRILALQNQLRDEFGIETRCAVELEGFNETGEGKPLQSDFRELREALVKNFPHVGYVYREASNEPAFNAQFEIVIGPGKNNPDAGLLSPLLAAETAYRIKTALVEQGPQYGLVAANFDAHPYDKFLVSNISDMHVNISLWDEQGNNLFADNKRGPVTDNPLLDACIQELIKLQQDTVAIYAPHWESYMRYGSKGTAPAETRLNGMDKSGDTCGSVSLRRNHKHNGKEHAQEISPELTRLENRLAGADADPYLVMVATLAALYEGARKHYHQIHIAKANRTKLPDNLEDALERLESSPHASEMLGPKLYNSIIAHYHPHKALGRAAD